MSALKTADCTTVKLSVDPVAKLFFYENRIFRAVNQEYIEQVKDMFDCGLIEELTTKGLFQKTWISDIKIDNYSFIIEHENIDHWNYPYEWSFDMLKDAGLLVLEVNNIANKHGYQLMDAHAYNVVFNMNKPQYIDIGSFGKFEKHINQSWKSYKLFYNHFFIPLYLWSKGYSDIAKSVFLKMGYFSEYEFFKLKHPVLNLLGAKIIFNFFNKIRAASLTSKTKIKQKFDNPIIQRAALILNNLLSNKFTPLRLERDINQFKKPVEHSMWHHYHDNKNPTTNPRFIRIKEIIDTLEDTTSVIELAANQGKFAEFILKSTHIEKIIATDYDQEALNTMYLNNKDKDKDNFLPLLFNVIRTSGRRHDKSIHDRIKSDIVIALAITHHLILTQNISIEYIFTVMKRLTNKYIIVEFMPMGLYSGNLDNIPALPEFYNLIWFRKNFIEFFDLMLEEKLEINRHVFVGKIKK